MIYHTKLAKHVELRYDLQVRSILVELCSQLAGCEVVRVLVILLGACTKQHANHLLVFVLHCRVQRELQSAPEGLFRSVNVLKAVALAPLGGLFLCFKLSLKLRLFLCSSCCGGSGSRCCCIGDGQGGLFFLYALSSPLRSFTA